ncbi:MAG: HAMP domain-containing histidine kinase, partial [Deltaproteobacteria bacterium]|nr:HAMP domain-containing histidine kinase [Deltaproteobacteria bacterium]
VRRLTGRLERLHRRVEDLGGGDLSARVEVEGKDEIAELAQSFNRAADRIEKLVGAQRNLLASASHELRTPLTRMRMAIELIADDTRPEVRERIVRDIGELDELVGELLLASKLDTIDRLELEEDVELLALVAQEGALVEAVTTGEQVWVRGDPRMLLRLARNLFENARRYGAGSPIEASVVAEADGTAQLCIEDRGPGVPDEEREKIFEPFYRPAGIRESADGGVGLGLSLVRKIAEHHGGSVRCVAREGGGTRFEVRLPTIAGR